MNCKLRFEEYCRYYNIKPVPEYVEDVLQKNWMSAYDVKLLHAVNNTHGFIQKRVELRHKLTPLTTKHRNYLKLNKIKLAKALNPIYTTVKRRGVKLSGGQHHAYKLDIVDKLIRRYFNTVGERNYKHILAFLRYFYNNPEELKPIIYPEHKFYYNLTNISMLYANNKLWIKDTILPICPEFPNGIYRTNLKDFLWKKDYSNYIPINYYHMYFDDRSELYQVIQKESKVLGDFVFGKYIREFLRYKMYLTRDVQSILAKKKHTTYEKIPTDKINIGILKAVAKNVKKFIHNWGEADYMEGLEVLYDIIENNRKQEFIDKYL